MESHTLNGRLLTKQLYPILTTGQLWNTLKKMFVLFGLQKKYFWIGYRMSVASQFKA